jgi:predicted metalloprotease with PDZ domain
MKPLFLLLSCLLDCFICLALDNAYHYSIDLTKLSDKRLTVELIPPQLTENNIIFSLPKIVPGTYSIYDFGRFVEDLKAYDASGNELAVTHIDTNSWEISHSNTLAKIIYKVTDTYHPLNRSNPVFEPAGTDFEKDTCYILNLHTMLGYFRGHTKQPYELNITHQPSFYGSTSLTDHDNSNTTDKYEIASYNEAIDNPIMYTRPDTAHLQVGESDILISVYSPSHKVTARGIAVRMDTLLQDQAKYLGGKLPVQKYSFLIYLADHNGVSNSYGALEHSYSSLYYLIDASDAAIAQTIRDAASHEFFHIVTPLSIHSEEIADFDFDHPKMSEHLWLYEGSTEYHAHLVQVRYGLITPDQYLGVLKEKMSEAMAANDSLSFTEMSKGCLDTFKDQYPNVYAKGMLINMCLDLKLLHLSDGKYSLMSLIQDLAKIYGKNKAFKDSELIPKIVSLTYPGIKTFFDDYVIGGKPLPLKEVLGYAGVDYSRLKISQSFSFGQCDMGYNPASKRMTVVGIDNLNEFGKSLGYKVGDQIEKINGTKITPRNFRIFRQDWVDHVKEGDKIKIAILRPGKNGNPGKKTLKGKVFKSNVKSYNNLSFSTSASDQQLKIRKAWLYGVN